MIYEPLTLSSIVLFYSTPPVLARAKKKGKTFYTQDRHSELTPTKKDYGLKTGTSKKLIQQQRSQFNFIIIIQKRTYINCRGITNLWTVQERALSCAGHCLGSEHC